MSVAWILEKDQVIRSHFLRPIPSLVLSSLYLIDSRLLAVSSLRC